ELTLVSVLRTLLRDEVRRHWWGLWAHMRDLRQQALVDLWERRETEEGRATIRLPLSALAKALIERPARKLHRARPELLLLQEEEPWVEANQEPMFELRRKLAIAKNLPRG